MAETKTFSIEIELTQGLTLEDYKDLADDIESAIHQCNYPVELTYEDGTTGQEDVIVKVNLLEKTEVDVLITDDEDEESAEESSEEGEE